MKTLKQAPTTSSCSSLSLFWLTSCSRGQYAQVLVYQSIESTHISDHLR